MCFPKRPPVDEMIRHQASLGAEVVVCEEGDLITDFPVLMSGAVKLSKLLYDGRCQIVGFLFCGILSVLVWVGLVWIRDARTPLKRCSRRCWDTS